MFSEAITAGNRTPNVTALIQPIIIDTTSLESQINLRVEELSRNADAAQTLFEPHSLKSSASSRLTSKDAIDVPEITDRAIITPTGDAAAVVKATAYSQTDCSEAIAGEARPLDSDITLDVAGAGSSPETMLPANASKAPIAETKAQLAETNPEYAPLSLQLHPSTNEPPVVTSPAVEDASEAMISIAALFVESEEASQESLHLESAEDSTTDSDESSACSSLLDREGGKSTRSSSLTLSDYPKAEELSPIANPSTRPVSCYSSSGTAKSISDDAVTALPALLYRRSRRSSCSSIPEKAAIGGWGSPTPVPIFPATAALHRHALSKDRNGDVELDLTLTKPTSNDKIQTITRTLNEPSTKRPTTEHLRKSKRLTKSTPHLRANVTVQIDLSDEGARPPRTPRIPLIPNLLKKSRDLISPPPPPPVPALKRVSMHAHTNSNPTESTAASTAMLDSVITPFAPSNSTSLAPLYSYSVTCTSEGRQPRGKSSRNNSQSSSEVLRARSPRPPTRRAYQPGLKAWDEDAFRKWEEEERGIASSARKGSLGGLLRRNRSVRRDSPTPKSARVSPTNSNGRLSPHGRQDLAGDFTISEIVVEMGLEIEHK